MVRRRIWFVAAACLPAILAAGCDGNKPYMTEERLDKGLVVILPGIEGVSGLNHDIRRGLVNAGVDRAMPIWTWGRPIPILGMFLNQIDFLGNRIAAAGLANRIRKYMKKYPDRPVHVIGHSGGGGVAVFVAEGLDEEHKLSGVILLSASISSAYNLTKALRHIQRPYGGIVNYYSGSDTGLLGVGTVILGNVDGTHGPGAGLLGFDRPREKASEEKKEAYMFVYQMDVGSYMFSKEIGSHAGTAQIQFVTNFVAPWIQSDWPPEDWDIYTAKDGRTPNTYTLLPDNEPDKKVRVR